MYIPNSNQILPSRSLLAFLLEIISIYFITFYYSNLSLKFITFKNKSVIMLKLFSWFFLAPWTTRKRWSLGNPLFFAFMALHTCLDTIPLEQIWFWSGLRRWSGYTCNFNEQNFRLNQTQFDYWRQMPRCLCFSFRYGILLPKLFWPTVRKKCSK